ncbi:unnamed protein product [Porites lobata]|uniref:Uncharacterized protein n=1 Tax=Porites lobata TaxID=104759 RepID=A0ABN8MZI9_9CNID|nr:unnamed protein product [Porites lobata]
MYVAPQYLPPEQQDLPAEYDGDEGPDYALDAEDRTTEILKDLDITDYDNVENILNQPEITPQKTRSYLNKVIYNGNFLRNQLKGNNKPRNFDTKFTRPIVLDNNHDSMLLV